VCDGAADRGRWQWPLSGGQEILVGAGGVAGPARPLVEEPTEAAWVRWNADQDRAGGYAIDQQAR